MRSATARLFALLAPALVALVTSSLLLVDYLRDMPIVCAEGGGCDALKHTDFAHVLGVPTPAFGVAAFALAIVLGTLRAAPARAAYVWVAAAIGAAGAGLIVLQTRIGAFCSFCVVTDVSAIALAVVAVFRDKIYPEEAARESRREVAYVALVLAVGVPVAIAALKRPILPDVIARQLEQTPKGQITVVDFADFECPFCRMTHQDLEPLLEAHAGRIRLVRELVPLTRIHPHALDAARAACCGEALGKGDLMANALFTAPVEELTPEGCEKLALSLGLDAAAYKACIADPQTDARIRADRETFDKATVKGDGLPLIWIGEKKLMGAQEKETLEQAIDAALARAGS